MDASPAPPAALESGPEGVRAPALDGYLSTGLFGRGGFATVWGARRLVDQVVVAIKVSHGSDPWSQRRFAHEAEVLAELGAHVPRIFDSGVLADGRPFIVMERLHGVPLDQVLAMRAAPPPLGWSLELADALLTALEGTHRCGFVHRDLKPENLFLVGADPSDLRLLDLGLAAPLRKEAVSASEAGVGSLEYMAPEQVQGERRADLRSDLYAVGAILYELVTLRPPFVGDAAAVEYGHLYLRPPRPDTVAPVPLALTDLIVACLAKAPADRPADAAWVRGRLAEVRRELAHDGVPVASAGDEGSRPMSLLAERKHPVVLLVVDSGVEAALFDAVMKQHSGFVARHDRGLAVGAFTSTQVDDPARAALAAARALVAREVGRVALHAAPLVIRARRRGPPSVLGEGVERPASWLPERPWHGIVLTADMADSLPAGSVVPAAEEDGFFVPADARPGVMHEPHLVGRDQLLARARASLELSLDTGTPGLLSLIGEHGVGRSRLARELARLARLRAPAAAVVCLSLGHAGPQRAVIPEPVPGRPLVVIVDDLHLAGDDLLDTLERLTLDTDNAPVWVAVTALPVLDETRPRWGRRAYRHDRLDLGPLAEDDALALTAELLLPVEYPPADFLRALVSWADRRPLYLVRVTADLARRGLVRPHAGGQGWYVAVGEVGALPATAAEQWLATRQLESMTPELAACVRLCAVLGARLRQDELAAVQDQLERSGSAGTTLDAGVGMRELVARGLICARSEGAFEFASAAFQEAVYALLEPDDRVGIHGAAARYWRERLGDDPAALEAFAHHARAAGEADAAARAYLQLGDRARRAYRDPRAESFYSAALQTLGEPAAGALARVRMDALSGRGRARYRMFRVRDALADLTAAKALGEALGERVAVAQLLLQLSTAFDWAGEYDASARCVDEALCARDALAPVERPATLEPRLRLAQGRTLWRRERVPEAIEALAEAAEAAHGVGDTETDGIANLLLASALVLVGRLEEAEERFALVIAICRRSGDNLHLSGAFADRMFLWSARRQTARAVSDLRRAIELAREIGNVAPEAIATHNLAELLYWSGEDDESLLLAARALRLHRRFGESSIPEYALLVARIHAARGESAEAWAHLAWVDARHDQGGHSPATQILERMLHLVLTGQVPGHLDAAWDELIDDARAAEVPGEELVELLWWRARLAVRGGRWQLAEAALAEAHALTAKVPIWRARIDTLAARIDRDTRTRQPAPGVRGQRPPEAS
ncbi:protein kinase domain-containing protein [Haliangium sp.]|uniref:serine/threonine-protein kinase n=1 Tax=Haliangium sp. TaxID=2663208 RepID=UPI003D0DF0A0